MRGTIILAAGAIGFSSGCMGSGLCEGPIDARSFPAPKPPDHNDSFKSPAGLPTGVVRIGAHVFRVEIAATAPTRARGLMGRKTMPRDAGMLFVYETPRIASFWMLNTPIPLDVAFIRPDLVISSITTMPSDSSQTHQSIEPVQFALEVPAGELARREIQAGDVVAITGVE